MLRRGFLLLTASSLMTVPASLAWADAAYWPVKEFLRICYQNVPFLERIDALARDEKWQKESAEATDKLFEKSPPGERSWILSNKDARYRVKIYQAALPASLKRDGSPAAKATSCMVMLGEGAPTDRYLKFLSDALPIKSIRSAVEKGNVRVTEWAGANDKYDVSVMYNEYIGAKKRGDYMEMIVVDR